MKQTNHDKTVKLPRLVHRKLMEISAARSIPIYSVISLLLVDYLESTADATNEPDGGRITR